MKKGKTKVWYRFLSSFLIFCFLCSVLWMDYTAVYAVSLPSSLPWFESLPYFMETIVTDIAGSNGIPITFVAESELAKLRGKTDSERYDECVRIAKENYPYEDWSPFNNGFGWTETDYDVFIEKTAEFYYSEGLSMDSKPIIKDKSVYDTVWKTIHSAILDNATKPIISAGKVIGTSFRDFCYQSQVSLIKDVALTYVNVVNPSSSVGSKILTGVSSLGVANVLVNPLFQRLNLLYRTGVHANYENALINKAYQGDYSDISTCDYTPSFWKVFPAFIEGGYILKHKDGDFPYSFYFQFTNMGDIPSEKSVYPLIYKYSDSPLRYRYGIATDCGMSVKVKVVSVGPSSSSGQDFSLSNSDHYSLDAISAISTVNDIPFYTSSLWGTQDILNGEDTFIHGANVIDVGTKTNFDKFCKLISSGKYTLEELLELMQKGWVAQPGKAKEGTVSKDTTIPKDIIDKSKEKYKENDAVTAGSYAGAIALTLNPAIDDVFGNDVSLPWENWSDVWEGTAENAQEDSEKAWTDAEIGKLVGFDETGALDRDAYNEAVKEGTKPGTDEKDPNDDKKPFVPGVNGNPDPEDEENVQWYERFPFSIPWDVMRIISFFSAEKKAPVFEIPAQFDSVGVKETIKIDLAQFSQCIEVIRVFIILSYVSGLVLVTRNIIKG